MKKPLAKVPLAHLNKMKATTERWVTIMVTHFEEAGKAYDRGLITKEEWQRLCEVGVIVEAIQKDYSGW